MADHTPDPWTVEDPMGAEVGLSIVQGGLKTYEWEFIATVCQSDASDERMGRQRFISPEEQAANARLIAAAPALLRALTDILANHETAGAGASIFQCTTQQVEAARAAVARAANGGKHG